MEGADLAPFLPEGAFPEPYLAAWERAVGARQRVPGKLKKGRKIPFVGPPEESKVESKQEVENATTEAAPTPSCLEPAEARTRAPALALALGATFGLAHSLTLTGWGACRGWSREQYKLAS